MVRYAAARSHPPAAVVAPVLIPTMPARPRNESTLYTVPATGRVAWGSATMWRNVGIAIATAARRNRSAAVLTVAGLRPLASAKWVCCNPSARAVAFIWATNAR
jgi:hypothetical protein